MQGAILHIYYNPSFSQRNISDLKTLHLILINSSLYHVTYKCRVFRCRTFARLSPKRKMTLIVLARGYRYNAFREIERRHLAPSAQDNIGTSDERRGVSRRFGSILQRFCGRKCTSLLDASTSSSVLSHVAVLRPPSSSLVRAASVTRAQRKFFCSPMNQDPMRLRDSHLRNALHKGETRNVSHV